jgi:uncharacterized coiled-coil DUF342 family protein
VNKIFGRKQNSTLVEDPPLPDPPNPEEMELIGIQNELILAKDQLKQIEATFHNLDLRVTLPNVFQERSMELSRQRALVQQLQDKYSELERLLGERRRLNAIASDRKALLTRHAELTDRLNSIETKINKSLGLIQAMKQQIDLLVPEKSVILQELGQLKQRLGEFEIN